MATVTGYVNQFVRSYEILRQPYVLDWQDWTGSDRNHEIVGRSFEVEVPDGYALAETRLGGVRLFAPESGTGGLSLADAIVRGIAKAPKRIHAYDGTEFVATQLAHGQQEA